MVAGGAMRRRVDEIRETRVKSSGKGSRRNPPLFHKMYCRYSGILDDARKQDGARL